jgi:phenylacetate-coenzyme A ligase PaaK-like adenylate-forming protein
VAGVGGNAVRVALPGRVDYHPFESSPTRRSFGFPMVRGERDGAMRFDFSSLPFNARAFSDKPMAFAQPEVGRFFSAILDLAAIETGPRAAREAWQRAQLRNLLRHAANRSPFWRGRIGAGPGASLDSLPILRRADVRAQVEGEGALLGAADRIAVNSHSTSGSSGAPVRFFVSEMNGYYNVIRSIAQYFIEGRDLTLNRAMVDYALRPVEGGLSVEREASWLGALTPFVDGGRGRRLQFFRPNMAQVWAELRKEPIGYLSISPSALEALMQHASPDDFKRAGAKMLVLVAEPLDPEIRRRFAEVGVPARETYSCEEIGPIAFECERCVGHFHVAASNVIVETVNEEGLAIDGAPVGAVLLTHLHSYATPFVRYEVGDLAALAERCPCGHDGPTLSNIVGRAKGLLKHPDGRLLRFHIWAADLTAIVALDEYRIRQTAPATLVVEIGGRSSLTPDETAAIVAMIRAHAGDGFAIEVRAVDKIDWGPGLKRLGFHNEIL